MSPPLLLHASNAAVCLAHHQGVGHTASCYSDGGNLPTNGEAVPDIRVERLTCASLRWASQLSAVSDDLESRYLAAARSSMDFALDVPGHGVPLCH